MALSQYYNRDRSIMDRWMATKQAAAEGWGNLVGDMASVGVNKLGKMKQSKLDKGYKDYTDSLTDADMDNKLTSDQWEAQSGKDYLKNLRQENKMRNKAEKGYGVKSKGLLGIAQRLLPGGASGYEPAGPMAPLPAVNQSTIGPSSGQEISPALAESMQQDRNQIGVLPPVPSPNADPGYQYDPSQGPLSSSLQGMLGNALGGNATTKAPGGQDHIMAILQQIQNQTNTDLMLPQPTARFSPGVYRSLLESKAAQRGGM